MPRGDALPPSPPRSARLAGALLAGLAAACSDRGTPAGPLRPGDGLLDALETSRVERYPESNLPPEILDLARRTLRVRTAPIPVAEWMSYGALPPDFAATLGSDTLVQHWFTRPPVNRTTKGGEVLVIGEGAALQAWKPGLAPFPGRSIWWDEASDMLHAFSEARPEGVSVEFEAEPSRVFGEFERALSGDVGLDGREESGRRFLPEASSLLRYDEIDKVSRRGLLLPAPASLSFPVVSWPSPELRVAVGLVDHAFRRVGDRVERTVGGSDGAEFALEIESEGKTREIWRRAARPGEPVAEESVDLSDWIGRAFTLRLRTEPGPSGDPSFDYGIWGDLRLVGGAERRPERPHVILVVIDTLRADGLGAYGAGRPTSPRIDAWAASKATVFRDALATAPWTLPSVASILTGLTSRQHGVRARQDALAPDIPTIATRLAEAGYETRAVTGGAYLRPAFGLHRGFERYDSRQWRRVPRDEALAWIETRGSERPFFLFFHTYYPHAPYPFDEKFVDRDPPYKGWLAGREVTYPEVIDPYNEGTLDLEASDRRYVRALYDALVAEMDAFVGRFLERLEDLLEDEEFVVILTSDHGEEFFEHDQLGHGHSLFGELLRVPLLVRFPRGREGFAGEVARPVSTLDVVPTLLEVAGLGRPEALAGRSLVGELPGRRARFAEEPMHELLAVVLEDHALLLGRRRRVRGSFGPVQLFDRDRDPGERENLHERLPEKVGELTRILERFQERYGPVGTEGRPSSSPDSDILRKLQELGYLGGR